MTSLSPWQKFVSTDVDLVQSSVGTLIKPHRLTLKNTTQPLRTRLRFVQLGQIGVMRLGYGADVRIQPEQLAGFYLIQLPQYGEATVRCGNEQVDSSPQVATVLNPNVDIDMVWRANNEQLMLKIDRALVEQVAPHFEQPNWSPSLKFPLRFQAHQHMSWRLMMRHVVDCARHSESVLSSPLVMAQLEQLVVTTFLDVHPPLDSSVPRRSDHVMPRSIRLVEQYLHAHADQPIRLEELAALAQISVRSLHAGFQQYCGISPMQYLRQIRLERVRHELCQPGSDSVTQIALRWGFMHLGRFSAEYKRRFGESPSQTQHRVRTAS
ncbi:MAG TPA: AraC family transcriptional regulator [Paenalcaligenes hominis]|mgnify:FL=1|uniref:AraC family transcriptional regulator n=1 Tax=Paenalcaligenes hominis TaxID=643674 RepID=A0A9D2VE39_9BURK|nr:AraC family transcriptional regulator [Paenalcaligenes hominis]NJB65135.1 AraC-like DNA-binding protein [Paenalcaligenes hominis]GGE56338.1 AraC family transcriptional regulator [Paenalcaligenes hominis]HJH22991.1 AraC family transcriptional regulator [Paenalcaligenes hominis]